MAYTPQTWADSPATSSPISAANLNHMEDGIAGNLAYRPLTSRTLSYSNGGQNSSLSSYLSVTRTVTGTSFSIRVPIRLPANTTSYTIKLRNYNTFSAAAGATALTLDGIVMGAMAAPSVGTTGQTGNFSGSTATTLVSTSATIPADGTFYTSPSITASGAQFTDGGDYILGIAFHAAASTTLLAGIGQCWYWNNNTSAINPATAASTATSAAQYIPLDVIVEYQVSNRKRAFLVVGDSIPEGTTGQAYGITALANAGGTGTSSITATPLHRGYVEQWARKRGDMMVQRHCLFASTAQTWANASYTGWTRQSTGSAAFDGAILTLGINDLAGGTTFANLQTYYASCLTNIRSIIGTSAPIYATNITPETFTATQGSTTTPEYYRRQFNDWLAQLPYGLAGVVDLESAMRPLAASSSGVNGLDYFLMSDGVHPSYQGVTKLTDALMAAIP
jgi:hypothetical protein